MGARSVADEPVVAAVAIPAVVPEPSPAPVVETAAPAVEAPVVAEAAPVEAPKPAEPAASLLSEAVKPAEVAKPEDKAAEPVTEVVAEAPVNYEFKLPEGVTLSDEDRGRYTELLTANKVAPEAAQALLDMHVAEVQKLQTRLAQNQVETYNKTRQNWVEQVHNDPELGGNRRATVLASCKEVINRFGGTEAQKADLLMALNVTGAGDHPAVIRWVNNVAKALAKPKIVAPPTAAPVIQKPSRAATRYARTMG